MIRDEVLKRGAAWVAEGRPAAVATIVRIFGSSSEPLGARMVATEEDFHGAVSGGCVETDVREIAREVISSGTARMLHYDQVEDADLDVGLNCEGAIDVLVEPLTPELSAFLQPAGTRVNLTVCTPGAPRKPEVWHGWIDRAGATAATGTAATDPATTGTATTDTAPANTAATRTAAARTAGSEAGEAREDGVPSGIDEKRDTLSSIVAATTLDLGNGRIALAEPMRPPRYLLIFGAHDIAAPLSRLAGVMGFRTVVSDPRADYARASRFPDADEVVTGWPHEVLTRYEPDARTAVVSLNHEPRFEDDLLHTLCAYPEIAYIGAIGKPQRRAERLDRAREAGVDLSVLPPVHTPVGLDLGGKEPEHIALSIVSEILAVEHGRTGRPLLQTASEPKSSFA
jgi:xanthine dehydrogenase accessory factor